MDTSKYQLDDLIRLVDTEHSDQGALERLAHSVELGAHLGELADHLVGHFVEQARQDGASWAEIGTSLGVTKQAAQKRFVLHGARFGEKGKGLFTRFATPAREVVRRAVGYAQAAGHGHVGTEHLVLGLIDDPDSLASRAIVAQGPTLDEVRAAAEAAMEPSGDASRGHIPFSNDSKKVLQLALREAIRGNDRPIGTEHILLGLLRDESLPGTVILTTCGVTHEATETWIRSEKG